MKFGYTIIYVQDISKTAQFFDDAFDIQTRFIHGSEYVELETGSTGLAFASHDLGKTNLPAGYIRSDESTLPLGMEIALISDDVMQSHKRAIDCGATEIKPPQVKSWGQTVSYVRTPDGILVELCSPMPCPLKLKTGADAERVTNHGERKLN